VSLEVIKVFIETGGQRAVGAEVAAAG